MRRRLALLGATALVCAGALIAAAPASAYERPALLERVASVFALRPAEVRCPSFLEWTSDPIWGTGPNQQRAWGYTDMIDEYVVLQPTLCAGALSVTDPTVPAWERATGVLVRVLVHESYHLRHWPLRRNEGKVECQAIRNFRRGAELLGASPELANDLLPYALAAHARNVDGTGRGSQARRHVVKGQTMSHLCGKVSLSGSPRPSVRDEWLRPPSPPSAQAPTSRTPCLIDLLRSASLTLKAAVAPAGLDHAIAGEGTRTIHEGDPRPLRSPRRDACS
jgi:hypothetical protein